jgi:glycosyltransferase involved in cell wall biosynthesis
MKARPPTVLFANWRDCTSPDSGGSERYVERVAAGLVERGYRVTILCPRHPHARRDSVVAGVRYIRRGGMYTIYLWALVVVLRLRPDLVVDVQNGMPFFSRLVTRRPVVVLVHHVHRQQWMSFFGPVFGRIGWWVESRVAPRMYRRCRYVTVSGSTAAELAGLGVDRERITVVPNGLDPVPATAAMRSAEPLLVAVSRLVAHKRIEHAIETVARLGRRWPTLRLEVVGRGPWQGRLADYAAERGVADRVVFHGFVPEQDKHEVLARAWVHLCPSVKEGWGIAVLEAGAHGVPTVAYHAAGGVRESILDRRTGLLAEDLDGFVSGVEMLLHCTTLRRAMGTAGRDHASRFEWKRSVEGFEDVIRGVLGPAAPRALRIPRQRGPKPTGFSAGRTARPGGAPRRS